MSGPVTGTPGQTYVADHRTHVSPTFCAQVLSPVRRQPALSNFEHDVASSIEGQEIVFSFTQQAGAAVTYSPGAFETGILRGAESMQRSAVTRQPSSEEEDVREEDEEDGADNGEEFVMLPSMRSMRSLRRSASKSSVPTLFVFSIFSIFSIGTGAPVFVSYAIETSIFSAVIPGPEGFVVQRSCASTAGHSPVVLFFVQVVFVIVQEEGTWAASHRFASGDGCVQRNFFSQRQQSRCTVTPSITRSLVSTHVRETSTQLRSWAALAEVAGRSAAKNAEHAKLVKLVRPKRRNPRSSRKRGETRSAAEVEGSMLSSFSEKRAFTSVGFSYERVVRIERTERMVKLIGRLLPLLQSLHALRPTSSLRAQRSRFPTRPTSTTPRSRRSRGRGGEG